MLGLCALGVALVATGPWLWVRVTTAGAVYSVADVPPAPVAIVLGAGLTDDGTPKPYLAARLENGLRLYTEGKVSAILVSGDHGRVEYDEVAAMTTWLTGRGVPPAKVVADHAGFDTWDSCVRAHEIFGVDRAIVVTQDYHARRAVYLCQEAGIDAVAVGSPEIGGLNPVYHAREVLATGKAVLDGVFEPDPRFLGRYETALDQALASG